MFTVINRCPSLHSDYRARRESGAQNLEPNGPITWCDMEKFEIVPTRARSRGRSLLRIGGAPVDVKLQGFGFPEKPSGGASWSVQLQVKLLFPK